MAANYQQQPLQQTRRPLRMTKTPRRETPFERIEGEAYEGIAELVLYRDMDLTEREQEDIQHDLWRDRCEAAILAGDRSAALEAIRKVKHHDSRKDDASHRADYRVSVAHAHIRVVPAMVCELEMGAEPATALERGTVPARRSRGGKGGRL